MIVFLQCVERRSTASDDLQEAEDFAGIALQLRELNSVDYKSEA